MKRQVYISLLVLLIFQLGVSQTFSTKSGTINFEASVSSFEEISATNQNVSAILNAENGQFACLALVKGFRFKLALMEEHFNENYAESNLYPKTTLKGQLVNFDEALVTEQEQPFDILGTLTFHGESKDIQVRGMVKRVNSAIQVRAEFSVIPEDFNIKIPNVVSSKIADEVNVQIAFVLNK